nr:MAG TPA: hypothetical protein [Caudoviricetes sp.]
MFQCQFQTCNCFGGKGKTHYLSIHSNCHRMLGKLWLTNIRDGDNEVLFL